MNADNELFQQLCVKLDEHVERFDQHEIEEDRKFDKLVETQQANTEAITKLTASLTKLVEDTSSIIQLHHDIQGATRVGKSVQYFMIWLLKWGAIGTGIAAALHLLMEHFNK